MEADVVIIGAGLVGCAIARELSRYELNVYMVDRKEDIGGDASKSNNGTVCAGYDLNPGTLHAKLVVGGNMMMEAICKELDVHYRRAGCIVVAFGNEEEKILNRLYRNSREVGLYDTRLISGDKCRDYETMLSTSITAGLLVPGETPIDILELAIAEAENAAENGVKILLSAEVTGIRQNQDFSISAVETKKGIIKTKYVINCAGIYADTIAKFVDLCNYRNYPRRGNVLVLDKNLPYMPSHVIQPTPNPLSRGK